MQVTILTMAPQTDTSTMVQYRVEHADGSTLTGATVVPGPDMTAAKAALYIGELHTS